MLKRFNNGFLNQIPKHSKLFDWSRGRLINPRKKLKSEGLATELGFDSGYHTKLEQIQ